MNYNELFRFDETDYHCIIKEYLGKENNLITNMEIPGTYNGKPVIIIGVEAFRNAVYLERVTLPDGLSEIAAGAFSCCSGLREIVWADGLGEIETRAFEGCTALERLELPEGLFEIYEYAFGGCTSLKEVILPHSLETLENFAFYNCSSLENVVFLNKDVHFGVYVLNGCGKLPAETLMYSLIYSCDIEKPFDYNDYYNEDFDWDSALREDVFVLAMKHNSFRLVDKYELFLALFNKHLMERYFPYMKKNGWIYQEEQLKGLASALCYYLGGKMMLESANSEWFADIFPKLSDSLFNELAEAGDVELTAWLLEYKNRRFGFNTGDRYEL